MKERINKVIKAVNMNPSEFADCIGISRASINHILNERNNPSMDVVLKILAKFNTINSDWLLFGTDPMYKTKNPVIAVDYQPSLFDNTYPESAPVTENFVHPTENEIKTPINETKTPIIEQLPPKTQVQKKIAKIVILYSDNTFDSLSPDF